MHYSLTWDKIVSILSFLPEPVAGTETMRLSLPPHQALDYLKRVKQYKDIGFSEKAIHEAHEKADKDWDKVLDILTQAR